MLDPTRVALALWFAVGAACVEPTSLLIEPLRVINWSPSQGAICVTVDPTIYATFSDELDPTTVDTSTIRLLDGTASVPATPTYDEATQTVRLELSASLAYDRIYTTVADAGVTGLTQGHLSVALSTAFRTVPRGGCGAKVECALASECGTGLVCASNGTCVACGSDADCLFAYGSGSACTGGACSTL